MGETSRTPKGDSEAPGAWIAVAFFIWALLFLFAPRYFGLSGDLKTICYVLSGFAGLIGLLGALVELSGMSRWNEIEEFGTVIFLLIVTMVMGAPPLIWSIPKPWALILKGAAFLVALITGIGAPIEIGKGIVRLRQLPRPPRERGLLATSASILMGALSLVTAVLGFVNAVASKH